MKILTQTQINGLDGKGIPISETEVLTLGKAIANMLAISKEVPKGDALKLTELAMAFYKAPEFVEIDSSDLSVVVAAVNANTTYISLVRGQVIMTLNEASAADAAEKAAAKKAATPAS